MTNEERVRAWIADRFDLESVQLIPFPTLPGGMRVRDREGREILAWVDLLRARVMYKERPPAKGGSR